MLKPRQQMSTSRFDAGYFSNFFDLPIERKVEGHKFRPLSLEEWLTRKVFHMDDDDEEEDGDDKEVGVEKDYLSVYEDEDDENCSKFDWLVGRWSECSTGDGACGVGIQNRSVICVRLSDKVPVRDVSCWHMPPTHTRSCQRPCPSDCLVGLWSPWSSCPVDSRCRSKHKEASRMRSRYIIKPDTHGGRECPSLVQVRPCDVGQCHTWKVVGRGACVIPTGATCGVGGNTSVIIECVNNQGDVVPHKNCPLEMRPEQWESCSIPCKNDCIISEWSDWSICSSPEHLHRPIPYRTRYKEILATAGNGGIQCINLRLAIDKERCPSSSRAIYHWATGNWSSCLMRSEEGKSVDNIEIAEDVTCHRQGFQRREVHCVDVEGEKMPNRRCPSEHMPALEKSCLLKCRVDCVVTLFSDWLPCPVTCLSEQEHDFDHGLLPYQLRHRFVLEHPREGGMKCPPLVESRPCLDLPRCSRLAWKVSAWSRCLVPGPEAKCGRGIRRRDVLCVDLATSEHKPSRLCSAARRPRPRRLETCHVTCAPGDQHCLFSDWSEWSVCSRRCDGVRWRHRTPEGTFHSPPHHHHQHRGHHPFCHVRTHSLVESQRCNAPCPEASVRFVGQWSHCVLNEAPPPSGLPSPATFSPSHESGMGAMRAAEKYCGIGSQYHAVVCGVGGGDDEYEDEGGGGGGGGDDGGDDEEEDVVNPEKEVGVRSGTVMAASYCSSESIREEMCFSSCKRDCLMSKWTDWKACKTDQRCGNGVTRRSRFTLEASLDGGRSCPVTEGNQEEQLMPCHITCDLFHWMAGDWSICAPIGQSLGGKFQIGQCGSGLQTRSVKCIKVSQFGEFSEDVDTSLCDSRLKPRELLRCHIPCHDECAVTMWSAWTACPNNCTLRSNISRHRHRQVVRNPSNSSCPRLSELEPCSASHLWHEPDLSCEDYEVKWSNWSPCMTFNNDLCGPGRKVRFAQCEVRSTRKPVSMEFCVRDQTLSAKLVELSEVSCDIPCVVDCVASEWLPWSPCSSTCNLGYRTRTRSVLVRPQNGGSLCPEVMLQNVSCRFQECFRWMAVGFGSCVIEKHSCGHGWQLMEFKCVKHSTSSRGDDEEVDPSLCSYRHLPKVPFVQSCYIPCPDECELGHWSVWSRCHVLCTDDHRPLAKYGLETRARHAIVWLVDVRTMNRCHSAELIHSRLCLAKTSHCRNRPIYDWQVGKWVTGERAVWCQDDLGNSVQGGCDEFRRPSSVRSCDHRCESARIPNSRCLSDGKCGCGPGFEPIYSGSDHQLTRCRPGEKTSDTIHLGIFSLKSEMEEFSGRRWVDDDDVIITKTNAWTYVIASVGLLFMVLLCIAIYYVCRRSKHLMDVPCTAAVPLPPTNPSEANPYTPRQTMVESDYAIMMNQGRVRLYDVSPQQPVGSFMSLWEGGSKLDIKC